MHTVSYKFCNEAQRISQISPDPLLVGGVWAQDYCYVSMHVSSNEKNRTTYNSLKNVHHMSLVQVLAKMNLVNYRLLYVVVLQQ